MSTPLGCASPWCACPCLRGNLGQERDRGFGRGGACQILRCQIGSHLPLLSGGFSQPPFCFRCLARVVKGFEFTQMGMGHQKTRNLSDFWCPILNQGPKKPGSSVKPGIGHQTTRTAGGPCFHGQPGPRGKGHAALQSADPGPQRK